MTKEELTSLIQRAMDGDLKAFDKVLEQKARQIIYIAVKILNNQQDGEDAAQEAMLKMYEHIGELKHPQAFKSWMWQITTRVCINYQKRLIREDHDLLDEEDEINEMRREFLPQEYIEDVDKRNFLMTVIDGLPEKYRVCLLLFYYENMTYEEIAEALAMPEKTVDNALQRAKRRIRQQLQRRFGETVNVSTFQGMVAIPVLSQLFELEAVTRIAPETTLRILAEAGSLGAAAAASAAASASTAASAGSQTAATAGTVAGASATSAGAGTSAATGAMAASTKILIGLVGAATAIGAAAATLPRSTLEVEPEGPDDPPAQTEAAILTLEDMIGETAASQLRLFASDTLTETEQINQWQELRDSLALPVLYLMDAGTSDYTLYQLIQQNKQLLVLENSHPEWQEVVFRFTDSQEEPPKDLELLQLIARWRG